MRRRRRYYGGVVGLDLGAFSLRKSVNAQDVVIGLGVGLAGAAGFAYALKTLRAKGTYTFINAPVGGTDWIKMGVPVIGGALGGGAAYMLRKRKNRNAAYANLIGAIAAGVAIVAWPEVAKRVGFSGVVGLDLPYGGMIVDDVVGQQYQGLIVNDAVAMRGYADHPGLGQLAAASLDEGEDYRELAHLSRFADYRAVADLNVG